MKPMEAYEVKLPEKLRKLLEKYLFLPKIKQVCNQQVKESYEEYEKLCNNAEKVINESWLNQQEAIKPLEVMAKEAEMKADEHEKMIHRFAPDWESPMRDFCQKIAIVIEDFKEISRIELENLKKSENN